MLASKAGNSFFIKANISVGKGTGGYRRRRGRSADAALLTRRTVEPFKDPCTGNRGSFGLKLVKALANEEDGLNRDGLKKWDPTNWVEPAAHNKTSFRILAIAAAVCVGACTTDVISAKWGAFVHLVAFATWFGSNFWTTFIGGITMYKNLPRQTFGRLQSHLFPKYFQLSAVTILTSLVTLRSFSAGVVIAKPIYITLAVSLVATLLNLLWLEPCATKVMFARYKMENLQAADKKEEPGTDGEISKLKKEFGKLHGISSAINLVALCGSVSHAFWLAAKLV
jgi:hypothetical protein